MSYKPTIGLEIHIELNTKTKMFCGSLNDAEERKPNVNVCPICMGHPGTLPVINEEAVKKTIKTGLALNCQIPEYSKFDRKNYFYPDLPKGYQISQYDMPFCQSGHLDIGGKKIRIRRVHLEEDTGRLVHLSETEGSQNRGPEGENYSLVDFNRAGVPLMELVTEPDITSGKEAKEFAEELHRILHYLNVSGAEMEKGQMRVEVNISLSKDENLGTKVEIKNLNSFRAVERGVDYEIMRQTKALEKGEKIVQETRGWDDAKGITVSQREKEEAHDYRYFPEPDLPILHLGVPEYINKIKADIPELPQQRRDRFSREYELNKETIEVFVRIKELGEYFEKVVSEFDSNLPHEKVMKLIKLASNYLTSDLQGLLKGKSISDNGFIITPENFADFIMLIENGEISSKIAKMILEEMFKTGADPAHIIKDKGLEQVSDSGEIEKTVREVIINNPKVVQDFICGKENSIQFLVGQVMAKTRGKANPQIVKEVLNRELTKLK